MKQLGNAVPVQLAEIMAQSIQEHLLHAERRLRKQQLGFDTRVA